MNSLKEAFSRKNMLKNLNFFGELNLGLILTAVGIVYFKNPNHFAFGGTSGLSILLADLFPKINVGGFMWIINLILVVLGFVFLGIKTMGWTIYSSFALSFFVSVCELARDDQRAGNDHERREDTQKSPFAFSSRFLDPITTYIRTNPTASGTKASRSSGFSMAPPF